MTKNPDLTGQQFRIVPAADNVAPDIHGAVVIVVDNGSSYFPTIEHANGRRGRLHRGHLQPLLAPSA